MNNQKDSASKGVSEAAPEVSNWRAPERIWLQESNQSEDWAFALKKQPSCDKDIPYARVHQPPEQNLEDKNLVSPKPKAPSHSSVVVSGDSSLNAADVDFDNVTFYAFRYCLGRQTYVVSDCVDILTRNWSRLTDATRTMIKKEIMQAFDQNRYGSKADRAAWANVLDLDDPDPITQDAGGLPSTTVPDPSQASSTDSEFESASVHQPDVQVVDEVSKALEELRAMFPNTWIFVADRATWTQGCESPTRSAVIEIERKENAFFGTTLSEAIKRVRVSKEQDNAKS